MVLFANTFHLVPVGWSILDYRRYVCNYQWIAC